MSMFNLILQKQRLSQKLSNLLYGSRVQQSSDHEDNELYHCVAGVNLLSSTGSEDTLISVGMNGRGGIGKNLLRLQ